MNLTAVVALTETQDKEYRKTYTELKSRLGTNKAGYFDTKGLFEDYTLQTGYARKTHRGRLKPGVELTELELSMVCDDGYSHFGGSGTISKDRTFCVVIYTD